MELYIIYFKEKCEICEKQQKECVKRKNRKSINHRINIHKFDMHGIPLPTNPIKQEQPRTQPPGEGRWVKPVDSVNVKAI